jgi:hypothetical protein
MFQARIISTAGVGRMQSASFPGARRGLMVKRLRYRCIVDQPARAKTADYIPTLLQLGISAIRRARAPHEPTRKRSPRRCDVTRAQFRG